MELNFIYFEKVKYELEYDAVVKIVYHMKKYTKKMVRRRAELAAKKAAAKGKKKGFVRRGTVAPKATAGKPVNELKKS